MSAPSMMRLRCEGRSSGHVHIFSVHEGTKSLKALVVSSLCWPGNERKSFGSGIAS